MVISPIWPGTVPEKLNLRPDSKLWYTGVVGILYSHREKFYFFFSKSSITSIKNILTGTTKSTMPFDKATNTKFYFRLHDDGEHDGLLSSLSEGALGCGIVVREEPSPTCKFQRFRYFERSESFLSFLQKIPREDRCFHEFIPGHLPQKPHFDIDIDASKVLLGNIDDVAIQTSSAFITALVETFAALKVTISLSNDVAWYESNSDYQGNLRSDKRSYHVIVNGVVWENAIDAMTFTEQVKKRMQFGSHYVDLGVAKNNSFLRLIGSHKIKGIGEFSGFKRRMVLPDNYPRFPLREPYIGLGGDDGRIPLDHEAYPLLELEESLVTRFRGETILPSFPRPEKKAIFDLNISEREVNLVRELLANKYGQQYSIDKTKCNTLYLKSHFRTVCEMCDRRHDSIEPFVFICRNGEVRFYCNRRPKEKIFIVLGNIQFVHREPDYGDEETDPEQRLILCGEQKPTESPETFSYENVIDSIRASILSSAPEGFKWDTYNWGKTMLPIVKNYHTLPGSESMLTAELMALKPFYTAAGYEILPYTTWKQRWHPKEVERAIEIPSYLFGNDDDKITERRAVHLLMCRDLMRCCRILSETAYHYQCLIVRDNGTLGQENILKSEFSSPNFIFTHESEQDTAAVPPSHEQVVTLVQLATQGKEMITQGQQMVTQGQQLLVQDQFVTQGQQMIKQGQQLITQGKKLSEGKKKAKKSTQQQYKIAIFWGNFNAEIMSINRKIGVTSCSQIFKQLSQDYRLINQQASDVDIDNAIRNGTGSITKLANDYIRNGLRNNQTTGLQCCLVDVFTVDKMMCPFDIIERSPQYITRYIEPAITRNRQEILYPSVMYRYHKFILDVCGGNIEACYNILNVLRFSLITGEKCPKCIFLCGPSGSGKSSFCQMISKIYGTDNTSPISFDHLNATFNSWAEKRLIVIEESNVTSRKSLNSGVLNKLKDIITNTSVRMERKNQEAITIENNCLLMICADRMEQIIDKGLIRRFIAVTPLHNGDFGDAEQGDLLELKQPENLRQLVAYLTSTPEEIAQWNTILPYDEQLYALDSIENIRMTCELMTDSKSKYSRGNTPQEKCWKALKEGHMKFPYELCFAKSDNKCWKAGAGQLYIHPEGFHSMFYQLMVSGGCTPEERYDMFATEAAKKTAHNDGNDNVTREMFGHSLKHKGKIEMRRLVDNWLTIWKLDDLGRRYTVNPGFESCFIEQVKPASLQAYGKFESTIHLLKGNRRWYRVNKEWFDAYKEIQEKPEDQVYPHFNVVENIDIGVSSTRAGIDGSLHDSVRVVESCNGNTQHSSASDAEEILWSTPEVRFQEQSQLYNETKFIPTPAIISSAMNSSFYS